MKNRISKVILVFVFLFIATPAFAAVDVMVVIDVPESPILNLPVVVPENCSVTDSNGVTANFSNHNAICALQAVLDSGQLSSFEVTDWGFGYSVDSINGIHNTLGWTQYWAIWVDDVFSDVGITGFNLNDNEALGFVYQSSLPVFQGNQAGLVVTDVYPRKLNIGEAISFLVAQQKEDGSFAKPLFSDWAAIAFGAYEGKSATALFAKAALKEWFLKNPIAENSLLTDYERRAMALMALNVNPYSGTSKNYIEAIMQEFDGEQFGSKDLVNDDIFAVLVLLKAGYETNVTPLLETFDFILSWQRESGSFGSVDLTAAAVQALVLFPEGDKRDLALQNARNYLALQQESTGGFGNVYSTSWVLQAIASLNEDKDAWAMELDKRTPEHFLALYQALDGGLLVDDLLENRIWATSYAIPAALQKSWQDILYNFERESKEVLAPSVILSELEDLSEAELVGLEVQITTLEKEIALASVTLQELKKIEQEVSRIALEVQELEPKVAFLHKAYLARVGQQDFAIAKEELTQNDNLAEFNVLKDGTLILNQESVLFEEQENQQFTAEVAGIQDFFKSSFGQALLTLSIGIILFLAFGGWRVVASLLRREKTAV